MLKTLKIIHNKIKKIAPTEHEIARLKNSGNMWFNKLVKKQLIAIVGIQNTSIYANFLPYLMSGQTFCFIILKFKIAEIEKHNPIAQTREFIPTYFGKNQMQTSIKIAPII